MTETQITPKCHRRDVHPAHTFQSYDEADETWSVHACGGRETVGPPPSHDAPLLQGEIRTHVVGTRTFKVQHVAGGSFTQATVTDTAGPTGVLATERFEADAVRSYAAAIVEAESARAVRAASPAYGAPGDEPTLIMVGNRREAAADAAHAALLMPWPGEGLRELVEAYGEAMARGAMFVVGGDAECAAGMGARADALKIEILKRFGGAA